MPGADASWHGEILRVPHVGAGQMIELASAAPLRFDGCRTVHLDDQRRAKVAIDFGDLFINASDEPWQPSASLTVAPRSSHVKFEDSVAAFGPMRRATAGELHRLLLGQLKIIAWEIMFKGRNLDSKKFLGAETITLENQETW